MEKLENMNVLVLGSGGREHSLCYNLIKSKKINNLWCIPGNAGINKIAKYLKNNLHNEKKEIKKERFNPRSKIQ